MFVSSYLQGDESPLKPAAKRTVVQFTPVVVFMLAAVFAWRVHVLLATPGSHYLVFLVGNLCVVSLFVFVALIIAHADHLEKTHHNKHRRHSQATVASKARKPE